MSRLSEAFMGANGRLSSKRVIGASCISFAMIITTITFFASGKVDIPPNVNNTALQFLLAGSGMIAAGLAEKKQGA